MEPVIGSRVPSHLVETEDRLFQELDNRRIGLGPDSWVALVSGVYMSDREGWVQVSSKDNPSQSVVVHIWPETTASQVALALWKWGEMAAADRPLILEAGRVDAH